MCFAVRKSILAALSPASVGVGAVGAMGCRGAPGGLHLLDYFLASVAAALSVDMLAGSEAALRRGAVLSKEAQMGTAFCKCSRPGRWHSRLECPCDALCWTAALLG